MNGQIKNTHPVDRLAKVRFDIAELKEEEAALKEMILEGECGMVGDDFTATLKETATRRFDSSGYRKFRGDEALKDWINESTVKALYVKAKR